MDNAVVILKKDLPGVQRGVEFICRDYFYSNVFKGKFGKQYSFTIEQVHNNPEWFERTKNLETKYMCAKCGKDIKKGNGFYETVSFHNKEN